MSLRCRLHEACIRRVLNRVGGMRKSVIGAVSAALLVGAAFLPLNAHALTLKEAMAVTLESNPEIGQAMENREAIEFELRQARGLYLPSIDLEAGAEMRARAAQQHQTDCRLRVQCLDQFVQSLDVGDGQAVGQLRALQPDRGDRAGDAQARNGVQGLHDGGRAC